EREQARRVGRGRLLRLEQDLGGPGDRSIGGRRRRGLIGHEDPAGWPAKPVDLHGFASGGDPAHCRVDIRYRPRHLMLLPDTPACWLGVGQEGYADGRNGLQGLLPAPLRLRQEAIRSAWPAEFEGSPPVLTGQPRPWYSPFLRCSH